MNDISFVSLDDIEPNLIISLMNNKKVGKYLPLLSGGFTQEDCKAFLKEKRSLWDEHGYGPWAFLIDGEFAGWGGLQFERGEADFALVLHPDYWGHGRDIFYKFKDLACNKMDLDEITAMLPPNRTNAKAIKRLGFIEDGGLNIGGECFLRFRLKLGE